MYCDYNTQLENVMELWMKKKHKKHASTVVRHFLACLCKRYGNIVPILFSVEDQRMYLETKWNVITSLDPEEIEAQ